MEKKENMNLLHIQTELQVASGQFFITFFILSKYLSNDCHVRNIKENELINGGCFCLVQLCVYILWVYMFFLRTYIFG